MSAILSCLIKIIYNWHFLFVIILIGWGNSWVCVYFSNIPHVLAVAVKYLIIQDPQSSFLSARAAGLLFWIRRGWGRGGGLYIYTKNFVFLISSYKTLHGEIFQKDIFLRTSHANYSNLLSCCYTRILMVDTLVFFCCRHLSLLLLALQFCSW